MEGVYKDVLGKKNNMKLCQGVYEWAQEILKLEHLPSLRENYQLMSMFQLKTLKIKNGLNSRNYRMNIKKKKKKSFSVHPFKHGKR